MRYNQYGICVRTLMFSGYVSGTGCLVTPFAHMLHRLLSETHCLMATPTQSRMCCASESASPDLMQPCRLTGVQPRRKHIALSWDFKYQDTDLSDPSQR